MAASLTVRVQSGATPGSQSAAVTGIDLISADNNLNTLANRNSNPITVPTGTTSAFSYEKYLTLKIDTAPANSVTNFKYWSAQGGAFGAGTGVQLDGVGVVASGSYVTPVSTSRASAVALPTTQGGASTWDSGSYSSQLSITSYLVLQLAVISTASPGNMSQATISFSYDEQ